MEITREHIQELKEEKMIVDRAYMVKSFIKLIESLSDDELRGFETCKIVFE